MAKGRVVSGMPPKWRRQRSANHPERTYSKGANRQNSSTSTAKDLVAGSALGFQENVTKSHEGTSRQMASLFGQAESGYGRVLSARGYPDVVN